MIDKGQILPIIRRVERARFWTPKVGFQNQFVTKSSQGSNNNNWRNTAESLMYGNEALASYAARDPEFKAKYGTLTADPASGIVSANTSSRQYGQDFYILKTKNISDRLTFFPDDSLAYGYTGTVRNDLLGRFILWKYRFLMALFMVQDLKSHYFEKGSSSSLLPTGLTSGRYWEIQILGGLHFSDVESFEFTATPPSGEFLRELQRHGIKIRDRRSLPAKEWSPEQGS